MIALWDNVTIKESYTTQYNYTLKPVVTGQNALDKIYRMLKTAINVFCCNLGINSRIRCVGKATVKNVMPVYQRMVICDEAQCQYSAFSPFSLYHHFQMAQHLCPWTWMEMMFHHFQISDHLCPLAWMETAQRRWLCHQWNEQLGHWQPAVLSLVHDKTYLQWCRTKTCQLHTRQLPVLQAAHINPSTSDLCTGLKKAEFPLLFNLAQPVHWVCSSSTKRKVRLNAKCLD